VDNGSLSPGSNPSCATTMRETTLLLCYAGPTPDPRSRGSPRLQEQGDEGPCRATYPPFPRNGRQTLCKAQNKGERREIAPMENRRWQRECEHGSLPLSLSLSCASTPWCSVPANTHEQWHCL